MELRDAGLLETRRDGRYIFYRLTEPQLLDLLIDLARVMGVSTDEFEELLHSDPLPKCCCPDCISQLNLSGIPSLKPPLKRIEEISSQK